MAESRDRMYSMQADLELARAANHAPTGTTAPEGSPVSHTPPPHDILKAHIARIAELEHELHHMRAFQSLRRRPRPPAVSETGTSGSTRRRRSSAATASGNAVAAAAVAAGEAAAVQEVEAQHKEGVEGAFGSPRIDEGSEAEVEDKVRAELREAAGDRWPLPFPSLTSAPTFRK